MTVDDFLTEALGSVRQLAYKNGAVILAKSYEPFGETLESAGYGESAFAYTGEAVDSTGLVYLRARYMDPAVGRFTSRDVWEGDYYQPMSYNVWLYTFANPTNLTDPSGMISCKNSSDTECTEKAKELYDKADDIYQDVMSGAMLPVEGYASLVDEAMFLFDDYRGMLWATTLVINGFDINKRPVFMQQLNGIVNDKFFYGENWLPYQNNPAFDDDNWCNKGNDGQYHGSRKCEKKWVHSRIGDWKQIYWDKTANQAYHSWFFTAVAFVDSAPVATFGNNLHDPEDEWVNYDFLSSKEDDSPPYSGVSKPDYDLGVKSIELGVILKKEVYKEALYRRIFSSCGNDFTWRVIFGPHFDPGAWIRSNYKQ